MLSAYARLWWVDADIVEMGISGWKLPNPMAKRRMFYDLRFFWIRAHVSLKVTVRLKTRASFDESRESKQK